MVKQISFILSGCFFQFFTCLSQIDVEDTSNMREAMNLKAVSITYRLTPLQAPLTQTIISSSDIKAKSVGQEPSFLFSGQPSITNYSDAGSMQGYSYIRLRGIDQSRINLTYNGVPMNEPEDQGTYLSNYPDILNSVSAIQIQRGVGTTKNGASSYAGSIEMVGPSLLADSMSTTFGIGYGSFNSMRAFAEFNSGLRKNKALYVRASHVQTDGYKYHSGNNSQSIALSGGLYYDKTTWRLNVLAGNQRNGMAWLAVADTLISQDPRTNGNAKQEKDYYLQILTQLENTWSINSKNFLRTSVYHTYGNGYYDFDYNNFLGLSSTDELYRYGLQSHLFGVFSNLTTELPNEFKLTTGIHANTYNRTHIGSEKTWGELYRNTGYKNELSAFAKIHRFVDKWNFFADIQYRYVDFSYKGSVALEKMNWHFVNPKAGASYNLSNFSNVYYNLGVTGREPTRNDMFGGNDDLYADTLGNPIIGSKKAEYVFDQELGFRYKKKKWNVNANLYFMLFKNEIVLDGKFGPNGLALTNNVERSFRTGVELSIDYVINKHFKLMNHSSLNYSRIQEQNLTFTPILTPPLIVNQDVEYSYKRFKCAISARYQHASYIDFANTSKVKSYLLLNARASYEINGFTLSAFLNNITNTKYMNHGYVEVDGTRKYFVQAPINFYLALQYRF